MKNMEEGMTYSLRTASVALGIHWVTVRNRARKLGIDTDHGLTAEQVNEIGKMQKWQRAPKQGTTEMLRKELAAIRGQ